MKPLRQFCRLLRFALSFRFCLTLCPHFGILGDPLDNTNDAHRQPKERNGTDQHSASFGHRPSSFRRVFALISTLCHYHPH